MEIVQFVPLFGLVVANVALTVAICFGLYRFREGQTAKELLDLKTEIEVLKAASSRTKSRQILITTVFDRFASDIVSLLEFESGLICDTWAENGRSILVADRLKRRLYQLHRELEKHVHELRMLSDGPSAPRLAACQQLRHELGDAATLELLLSCASDISVELDLDFREVIDGLRLRLDEAVNFGLPK